LKFAPEELGTKVATYLIRRPSAFARHGVHERLESVREVQIVVNLRHGRCTGRTVLELKYAE
jgi:hypothetical protein